MNNKFVIAAMGIAALAAILGFKFFFSEETTNQPALETQTNDDGPVAITVVPIDIRNNSAWRFEITLDTHSGELNQNLIEAVVLIDINGNEYKPNAWIGDPPGGHHRKGVLEFEPIFPSPKIILLKIRGIGGVQERNFAWGVVDSPD